MSDQSVVDGLVRFVRARFATDDFIPLHAPVFAGNEQAYVLDTIQSTFVSSVGAYVDRFEADMAAYTGCERAVATMNGTAALHMALRLVGVEPGDLVVTQPLTFVATCNAIAYCGAEPVFVDVDRHTLGLSPAALDAWLAANALVDDGGRCVTNDDGRVVRACVPMHTFGHPADIDGLVEVCARWGIALIEDAAESLGSFYKGRHTGIFGAVGTLSFNGNKVITTGGGGMLLTDATTGKRAKHLTTTAKVPHAYEYVHDEVGYNYRLPNLNAALGCAQLEQLDGFVARKRALADDYRTFLDGSDLTFVVEPDGCRSNYWLNAVICQDMAHREALLAATNREGVMTRPIWALMNNLGMYAGCRRGPLDTAQWLEERVVNLPSSVPPEGAR
ncbi:aminotransferase DegT [Sphingomonas sp. Leaf412]|uniref:LegC family aminotransferase n=1 Tax=Sphingomonas sp. Leaf412 TaxID=1736370 RepID=UPI0006FFE439|nr:LegC family aminotransferase [Sphingomonas sp. Leaf412]KQT31163.1 aminotransferase DegT [Sphingomonas sp. Leaf412]